MAARDFKRLGAAVVGRRAELRLNQEEFVREVELSAKGLQRIEAGTLTRIRAKTLGELDSAARWEPGSAIAILEGGDPTPVQQDRPGPESTEELPEDGLLDDVERKFWAITELSTQERRAYIYEYRARQKADRPAKTA